MILKAPLIFVYITVIIILSDVLYAEEKEIIKLPDVKFDSKISLEEAIRSRRSIRNFEERELSLEQIGKLLWAASGITDNSLKLRSAPSAGALYPLEIYIVKKDGLFHYEPYIHSLRLIREGDLRRKLCESALNQTSIEKAPLSIIILCDYKRTTIRYGNRGIQYVHIEAGHVAQNIHLEAVSLGLGSVPIGAFQDDRVKEILGLQKFEVLYIIPVGYPES
ncbi:MAG: SagB/ThcOx family dehydrogenase [Candidatus Omnitrophica bacterium]|nr:SagB/ThcOx family dehydrogenase [Candidatus Omnitrophota bacterium]